MIPGTFQGFEAKLATRSLGQADLDHSASIHKWKRTFLISLLLAVPTVLLAFIPGVPWPGVLPGVDARDIILFMMSTVVQVGVARRVWPCGCGLQAVFTLPLPYMSHTPSSVSVSLVSCLTGAGRVSVLCFRIQISQAWSCQHGCSYRLGNHNRLCLLCELITKCLYAQRIVFPPGLPFSTFLYLSSSFPPSTSPLSPLGSGPVGNDSLHALPYKDVLRDPSHVASLCLPREVPGTHCQGNQTQHMCTYMYMYICMSVHQCMSY